MMSLETPRLLLRTFAESDLDDLPAVMANPDFMRFSLGVCSREQTADFLEKLGDATAKGYPRNLRRPISKTIG